MAPRRPAPQETPPDLAPERAYKLLSAQLEKLNDFKNLNYQQAEQQESEWFQLTQKLVLRSSVVAVQTTRISAMPNQRENIL